MPQFQKVRLKSVVKLTSLGSKVYHNPAMLETPHALVGAAIATKIPNPLVSLPLAFVSHFVLDMVPHWNPHLNTELKKYGKVTARSRNIILADVVAALGFGTLMATQFATTPEHMVVILFGAFAGVLPDVVEAPYFFFKVKNKALEKWLYFQKAIQVDTDVLPGMATQIATIIAAVWWMAGS